MTLTKDVLKKYKNKYFFETGTNRGNTVKLALELGFEKIFSIEIVEYLYKENLKRFKNEIIEGKVYLFHGDTVKVMPEIIEKYIDKQTTFWLDAHKDNDEITGFTKLCPLLDELEYIKSKNFNHTILVDDRRCLGGKFWGKDVGEIDVINKIKEINIGYNISYENGYRPNDIIVAKL